MQINDKKKDSIESNISKIDYLKMKLLCGCWVVNNYLKMKRLF